MTAAAYAALGYTHGLQAYASGDSWYPSWFWHGAWATGFREGWCDAQNASVRAAAL